MSSSRTAFKMVRETGPKITPPMPNNSIPAYTEIIRYNGLIPTSFPISLGSKISLKNVTTQKRVVTIEDGVKVSDVEKGEYKVYEVHENIN